MTANAANTNGDGAAATRRQDELTGGCLCGAIRFRAIGRPLQVNYCHCSQCRRHAGAPVAAFATYPAERVIWTQGSPRLFRSSAIASRGFCADCGASLSWQAVNDPLRIDLGIGCFDDAATLTPSDHIWTESAIGWLHIDDSLPRFRRARQDG